MSRFILLLYDSTSVRLVCRICVPGCLALLSAVAAERCCHFPEFFDIAVVYRLSNQRRP